MVVMNDLVPQTAQTVEGMLPYYPDNTRKSNYLSYRAVGFTLREAINLAGISERTVKRWREEDEDFAILDTTGLMQLKKNVGAEYLNIEFSRNFRLALEKDFQVLSKSVQQPEKLTDRENQYLLKIRSFYTPQQYAIIQQLVGEATQTGFDFTKMVFEIRREKEEMIITRGGI